MDNKVIFNKNYLEALQKIANHAEPGFIDAARLPEKLYMEYDTSKSLVTDGLADVPYNNACREVLPEELGGYVKSDSRYNVPKEEPKATEEEIKETVSATEIYRQARLAVVRAQFLTPDARSKILLAQDKQVAYGIDKYPEPLNPNTWDIDETIAHIMDESIDRLHYLVMLRIKLEQSLVNGAYNEITKVRNTDSRIASINHMINKAIEEMNYLVMLSITNDKETRPVGPDDSVDSLWYAIKQIESINVNDYGKSKNRGER